MHVQYVWNADMPGQLLLLLEMGGCLYKAQHCLVDMVGCYCIQPGPSLPKSTSDQLLKAAILHLHQLFAL